MISVIFSRTFSAHTRKKLSFVLFRAELRAKLIERNWIKILDFDSAKKSSCYTKPTILFDDVVTTISKMWMRLIIFVLWGFWQSLCILNNREIWGSFLQNLSACKQMWQILPAKKCKYSTILRQTCTKISSWICWIFKKRWTLKKLWWNFPQLVIRSPCKQIFLSTAT